MPTPLPHNLTLNPWTTTADKITTLLTPPTINKGPLDVIETRWRVQTIERKTNRHSRQDKCLILWQTQELVSVFSLEAFKNIPSSQRFVAFNAGGVASLFINVVSGPLAHCKELLLATSLAHPLFPPFFELLHHQQCFSHVN